MVKLYTLGLTLKRVGADMRIVPLGSGGAILDLDWFLNYCDISIIVPLFSALGSGGMPPVPPTILMSGSTYTMPWLTMP